MHRATNQYRDIPNVILAGTLFLPSSVIEGRGQAALGISPEHGGLTPTQQRDLFLSIQADYILQAVCHPARRAVGGDCGRCDAYLIASPRHGVAERLIEVFPGCTVEEWAPIPRPATGRVAEALRLRASLAHR